MTDEEILTQEEIEALREMGYGYPQEEEKANIFNFFKRIITSNDTRRTSNLTKDELGMPEISVRGGLGLSLFCESLGMKGFADYFEKESLVTTDTSLSREGALINLAVTQKRTIDKKQAPNIAKKGWFNKKEPEQQQYY